MGSGDWECILKPLNNADIRAVSSHQDDGLTARTGPREGHRRVSWIYMTPGGSEDSIQLNEGELCTYSIRYPQFNHDVYTALRVEWLKARARRDRWREEVDLLVTEITRAALFFDNWADWWSSLVGRRSQLPPDLSDGLCAYTAYQADIQRRCACHVRSLHNTAMHTPTSSPPPLPSEPPRMFIVFYFYSTYRLMRHSAKHANLIRCATLINQCGVLGLLSYQENHDV